MKKTANKVHESYTIEPHKEGFANKNILPGTVALGGSIKDTKPRSLNPERGKLMGFVLN